MTRLLDEAAVERAAAGLALKLPRVPHRGKVGEVRASSVGASMELHDFREYQPGDDLRHLDWNAVARTGDLILRVRQDEVSPRVEVLVDASASMGVSPDKAARARELAAWACVLARRGGLEPSLVTAGRAPQKAAGATVRAVLGSLEMDGREPFDVALRHAPPLLPCGLRVVVSDFLFETVPDRLAERLSRGASGLALLQVLDEEDLEPSGGHGAQLTDAETGEVLERILTQGVLDSYQERLAGHLRLWQVAARRVHAEWIQVGAARRLDELVRRELQPLVEAA